MKTTRILYISLSSAAMTGGARAVELPRMFSDHGVLQQGSVVPVWGLANPGETGNVEFGGQKATGKADSNGEWRIGLSGLTANATARNMTGVASRVREFMMKWKNRRNRQIDGHRTPATP